MNSEPNYRAKVMDEIARLQPEAGRVYVIEVMHDDDCDVFDPDPTRVCNCDCQLRLVTTDPNGVPPSDCSQA